MTLFIDGALDRAREQLEEGDIKAWNAFREKRAERNDPMTRGMLNLRDVNLDGIDLSNAQLDDCDLRNATLRGTRVNNADFEGSLFNQSAKERASMQGLPSARGLPHGFIADIAACGFKLSD